ncbi:MAG: transposase [Chlamydiales bacterium]|nr:transposase [Chlamydiales bacterium]
MRCGLMIKVVFRTALRALQGFVRSLIEGLGFDIVCPPLLSVLPSGERSSNSIEKTAQARQ